MTNPQKTHDETLTLQALLERDLALHPLQRPFKWTINDASGFFMSLEKLKDVNCLHIGTLLIEQEKNTQRYLILDGQQRLTTLLYWASLHEEKWKENASMKAFLSSESLSERSKANLVQLRDTLLQIKPSDLGCDSVKALFEKINVTLVILKGSALMHTKQALTNPTSDFVSLDDLSYLKAYHYQVILEDDTKPGHESLDVCTKIETEFFKPDDLNPKEPDKRIKTLGEYFEKYNDSYKHGFIRQVGAGLRFEMRLWCTNTTLWEILLRKSLRQAAFFQGDPYRCYLGQPKHAALYSPLDLLIEPTRFAEGEGFFEWLKLFEDLDAAFSKGISNLDATWAEDMEAWSQKLEEQNFAFSENNCKVTHPQWHDFLVSMQDAINLATKAYRQSIEKMGVKKGVYKKPFFQSFTLRVYLGAWLHWGARFWRNHKAKDDVRKKKDALTPLMAQLVGLCLMRNGAYSKRQNIIEDAPFYVLAPLTLADVTLEEAIETLRTFYCLNPALWQHINFTQVWPQFLKCLAHLQSQEKEGSST